jgi:hypothetical protein
MNPPTLDPFPSRSNNDISIGSLAITAIILGIATVAVVFYFKMPKPAAEDPKAKDPLAGVFSETLTEKMKDWDFYTTEIGTALQELRDAKEKYENQSKALFETELRLEAEKEDLARIRKDIETMRSQLTGSIHTITSSKASTTSPTTPQKPQ